MEARWVEVPALVKYYQKVKAMAVKQLHLIWVSLSLWPWTD